MTVRDNAQVEGRPGDPFAYLYPYEFVLLTTFRKSGAGVPTAVWFAHERGKLYMVTEKVAGKVKRIHNNRRVLLAPCDVGGRVLGKQIEAYARELPDAKHAHAEALLVSKYGAEYGESTTEESPDETFLEIEPIQGVVPDDNKDVYRD